GTVSETGMVKSSQAIAPSNENISQKANAGSVLKNEKTSGAAPMELNSISKNNVQVAEKNETLPSTGSPIEIITTSEFEAPATEEIVKPEEAPAELVELPEEL